MGGAVSFRVARGRGRCTRPLTWRVGCGSRVRRRVGAWRGRAERRWVVGWRGRRPRANGGGGLWRPAERVVVRFAQPAAQRGAAVRPGPYTHKRRPTRERWGRGHVTPHQSLTATATGRFRLTCRARPISTTTCRTRATSLCWRRSRTLSAGWTAPRRSSCDEGKHRAWTTSTKCARGRSESWGSSMEWAVRGSAGVLPRPAKCWEINNKRGRRGRAL